MFIIHTNASTRFATFGILGFFEFSVLSGKFRLNQHSSKRVMQALYARRHYEKSLSVRLG
ncbi:hypothetical protein ERW49_12145 [Aliivibrio finisterrensis]|uniref:Uncharacterized protein n=1 Tax=Aliivibrio finisterrensis TaxID=511998 RepID=A0A4Q5KIL2_9GAMM|nr:hypothetical protein ERW49_12145 [Aliivibrio finisterrensis]